MQRQLLSIPIVPGTLARLAGWIRDLDERRADLAAVLHAEGIAVELVAIDRTEAGESLLIYTSGPDLQAAAAAFAQSQHPVDVGFKAIMAECLVPDRARVLEVLLGWP